MKHLKNFRIFESNSEFWKPLGSSANGTSAENKELTTISREKLYYNPDNEAELAKKIEDFAKKYPESIEWLKIYSNWRITNLKPGGGLDNNALVISSEKSLCEQFETDLLRKKMWNSNWDDSFQDYIEYVAIIIDDKPAKVTKIDSPLGSHKRWN